MLLSNIHPNVIYVINEQVGVVRLSCSRMSTGRLRGFEPDTLSAGSQTPQPLDYRGHTASEKAYTHTHTHTHTHSLHLYLDLINKYISWQNPNLDLLKGSRLQRKSQSILYI